ncbi:MAG: MATE family efflux transporter [Clostridiales bacterium]|nr:MATE family efflux transporter [Clostridiales bacterium]
MNNKNEFLGTQPIGKLLVRLSIPTVVAQLINMLYNIVDRIYIGHMPGDGSLALTGVGVCMPLIMLVAAFAALVSSGGAPRASIFMGRQDNASAEKTLGNCFSLQLIVSLAITAVLLIWNEDLLLAFGASENTIGYATDYMNIYAMGTLFVQLTLGMNTFITAQGFTSVAMMSVVIGAVSNIVLDPVFIFVLGMGVEGAALATILSQFISCLWILAFLSGKKTLLKIRRENLRLQARIILPCIALGAAAFVMQASESVISVCFNSSLLRYGGDIAVGTMTILSSVMQFAMLPMQGVAQGAQPILSYNYGAKNEARVKKAFRLLLITCLTYSLLLWGVITLIPHVFVGIFTPDEELIRFASPMLRIYLGGIGIFGIQIACQMAFTSLGKAVNSIIVAVMRKFVLLIPLIYIMPHLVANPTTGVFMAEPVADILAVIFTAILFSFQFKKALKEMAPPLSDC